MPYTNDQLAALMSNDVTALEQKHAQQQAMASALRGRALQGGGSGVAAGVNNALAGIGAGMGYRQGQQGAKELGDARAEKIRQIVAMLKQQPQQPPMPPQASAVPPVPPMAQAPQQPRLNAGRYYQDEIENLQL